MRIGTGYVGVLLLRIAHGWGICIWKKLGTKIMDEMRPVSDCDKESLKNLSNLRISVNFHVVRFGLCGRWIPT